MVVLEMKKNITVKVSDDVLELIKELIQSGKYKNRNQIINKALDEFLAKEIFSIDYLNVKRNNENSVATD
ncbi:ribbon-helix-helix protein, CopG family [Fervidicoccus fontis]|jgi:Arc/MetJ-type ribon-helix-helix transcriptional regulator|uniref:Ribbon-helix-helix protein, CopG family n=1 Tax=Fervidicoccus fontis TaxID=683846 RepID=A0A843A798_9CREN|nr:ribbon-helix-helix protein, CopG family [Fervidicoccus fontis]